MCCSLGLRWRLRSGVGAAVVARALGWWLMWRVTGARRCGRILISRARWAGSPAFTRSGAWSGAQADQGAVAGGAWQRAWLWIAAVLERADGFAAFWLCGAADRLQLSRAVCGAWGSGLGSGGGGFWAGGWGRCGHAACALP